MNALAAAAASDAAQLDASTQRIAQLGDNARMTGERTSAAAQDSGATAQKSIKGFLEAPRRADSRGPPR